MNTEDRQQKTDKNIAKYICNFYMSTFMRACFAAEAAPTAGYYVSKII
jgi:hypothetical protein